MTIAENITTFAGLPVVTVEAGSPFPEAPQPVAWRLTVPFDAGETEAGNPLLIDSINAAPDPESVTALVIGMWASAYDSGPPMAQLADALGRFPALTALFVGEMTYEECEISWISQGDYTPLLTGLGQRLDQLWIRGGSDLAWGAVTLPVMTQLVIQTGGLDARVVRGIAASTLPRLTHLELWLGTDQYGANTTDEDIRTLLDSPGLPALTHLGLKNSDRAEAELPVLAGSSRLRSLRSLDLSMGVLDDDAIGLLTGGAFAHLRVIDLRQNYFSADGVRALRTALPQAITDDQREIEDPDEDWSGKFVAVGE